MDQAKKLLSSLSIVQRFTIVLCGIAVAAGVLWFSRWQHEQGMRPLYSSLAPEDASAMVQKLRESGVAYRVSENGTTLLVPEDRVPELRLEMAGLGLPKTGRIGFEIFDKTNFGITDFAEHVNYRRAVEGELERSVMALAEVRQARVHVTLPKDSVFTDSQEAAKASVLVGLRPGARLSPQNVFAITNLVSSAVEGLVPASVSVVDMNGNLLSRPRRDAVGDGTQITEATLEYRQAIEHDLVVKISNTLDPLLGSDKFRTGVSADVDMSSGEESEESFDPTKSVMLTSQKIEDSTGTSRSGSPTPPGTASNLPQQASAAPPVGATPPTTASTGAASAPPQLAAVRPSGTSSSATKRSENITYQSSRTVKHMKIPLGTVKRLSIAVLIDQGSKWEGQGKQAHLVVTPTDPAKIKTIQSVVATLVGLNPTRGDQLTVETLPFDSGEIGNTLASPLAEPSKKPNEQFTFEDLQNKPALRWGSAGGAVLLVALAAFALTRRKKRPEYVAQEALPAPSARTAALASASEPGLAPAVDAPRSLPALMPSRTEVLINQLQESGRTNPEAWVGILRTWLSEEEAN
ncbi:MAG: flagellar basal-body MS-ring/collar protein FliF [Bryobacteraceae bacterium]